MRPPSDRPERYRSPKVRTGSGSDRVGLVWARVNIRRSFDPFDPVATAPGSTFVWLRYQARDRGAIDIALLLACAFGSESGNMPEEPGSKVTELAPATRMAPALGRIRCLIT